MLTQRQSIKAFLSDSQDWWHDLLEEDGAEATVESLRQFILVKLLPSCRSHLAEICHHDAIKRQVIGEGVNVQTMENLSRYETHLDRKFERTLAMLIKLKELGGKG